MSRPGAPQAEPEKPAIVVRRAAKPKKPAEKIDPGFLRAARELRDRYLEAINEAPPVNVGKYDVVRALPAAVVARGARGARGAGLLSAA